MNKKLRHIASAFAAVGFLVIAFGCDESGSESASSCGCSLPSISIPSYADSWEDKEENWSYKECAIAQSDEVIEKVHVYVFYNSKIDKYRCELRYSWPGNDCRLSSKLFGMKTIATAEISKSIYQSGEWKTYNYWLSRQNF